MISQVDQWRKEYTELLKRERNAEDYLDNCTPEEVETWKPEYQKILARLNELLSLIQHYKPENILEGWPELLNPQPKEEKKEIKKEELKTARLF